MVRKATNEINIIICYRNNYKASYHTRELARLLNTNHTTLLPYLHKLEKDKILKTLVVGKNKEYSLNFDNINSKEYISLAEKNIAIEYLKKNFLIKKIYEQITILNLSNSLILFGSYVKGYATKESDIDIFCLGQVTDNQVENIKKIGKTYGKTINIKKASISNFENALKSGDTLTKEIIKDHIILINSDLFVNLLWWFYGR